MNQWQLQASGMRRSDLALIGRADDWIPFPTFNRDGVCACVLYWTQRGGAQLKAAIIKSAVADGTTEFLPRAWRPT